jgi:phosphatidylinositol alpha 1,6-mannosyltransferase
MRIAVFVEPSISVAGTESLAATETQALAASAACASRRMVRHLVPYLAEQGHALLLCAPSDVLTDELLLAARSAGGSISSVTIAEGDILSYFTSDVTPWMRVQQALMAFHPDLLHLANPTLLSEAGLRYAVELGTPVVASLHGSIWADAVDGMADGEDPPPAWLDFDLSALYRRVDQVICSSQPTWERLDAAGFRRLCLLGTGVDPDRFSPCRRSRAWRVRMSGGVPDAVVVLGIGPLLKEAATADLRRMAYEMPSVRLAILGEGRGRRELEKRFEGTPTVFLGDLDDADLPAVYASADVCVLPGVTHQREGLALELLASALPIVAPWSGEAANHVAPGYRGLLFAPGDPLDMIVQLRRLVSDPVTVQVYGENARRYAEQYRWQRIFDDLLAQYMLIERSRRASRRVQNPLFDLPSVAARSVVRDERSVVV